MKFKQVDVPEHWEQLENNRFTFRFFNNQIKSIKFISEPKKPFVSNGGIKGIQVDRLFFEKYNAKERKAILWHEYYHCRGFGLPLLGKQLAMDFFITKPIMQEEFEADRFSAINNNANDCLSYLKTSKVLYEKEIINFNPKNHPPIDERIKRIKELIDEKSKTSTN